MQHHIQSRRILSPVERRSSGSFLGQFRLQGIMSVSCFSVSGHRSSSTSKLLSSIAPDKELQNEGIERPGKAMPSLSGYSINIPYPMSPSVLLDKLPESDIT
jgi:hypothetical protein